MAGVSSIDIMGSLSNALSAITKSKIDLSLPDMSLLAQQEAKIKKNQELTAQDVKIQAALAEAFRKQAIGVRQAASGGVGKNIRAPARIRDRI